MQWTYGRGKYGPVIDTVTAAWADYITLLADMRHARRTEHDKAEHWWTAPFIRYDNATQREIKDIEVMAPWIGIDVDHGNLSLAEIRVRMGTFARFAAWTTTASRVDNSRWRIQIGLSRKYSVAEYGRIFRWYEHRFPEIDPTGKNANRIHYCPAQWADGDNLFWAQDGRPCNVDTILTMVPEIPPPEIHHADLRRPPGDAVIITEHMVAAAQQATEGGRLFRLMCAAAKRYRLQGWDLTAGDLADAALDAAQLFSPGKKRIGVHREAGRAIQWALQFKPETALEKMRNRILWERTRKY